MPSQGFEGEVPEFPLPAMRRFRWEFEDKRRFQVFDEESTELFRDREVEVWEQHWATPQACAWSMESWRWPVIAEFCRLKTVVEQEPDANASLVSQLHRYRDQIGMTPAGMKDNGWAVAVDELAGKRAPVEQGDAPAPRARRLRAASDGH